MACTGVIYAHIPCSQSSCCGHSLTVKCCLLMITCLNCWDVNVVFLQPQDAYGLEKLASEELAKHYDSDFGIECRIARCGSFPNMLNATKLHAVSCVLMILP